MENRQIVIVEDTRNKPGLHDAKNAYFRRKGIQVIRSKLYVADYSLLHDMRVCVDTKEHVDEVVSDLIHQHERFRNEADRAYENGIRLYILVENTEGIRTLEDIRGWSNPRYHKYLRNRSKSKPKKPPIANEQLYKAMKTFSERHHCKFVFTSPESAGRAVLYLLTGKDWGE